MKQTMLLLALFLLLGWFAVHNLREAADQRRQKEAYRQNNEVLISNIRRIYDEKEKLIKENESLSTAAEVDKAVFDWHADISRSAVIKRLRQR